jgi:hypothetical protein
MTRPTTPPGPSWYESLFVLVVIFTPHLLLLLAYWIGS